MATYDLENPNTGLSLSVEMDAAPTQQQAREIFARFQQSGLNKVERGFKKQINPDTGKKFKAKDYYAQNIPDALGIPRDGFDPENGASFGLRTKLDFFRQKQDQAAILKNEFGEENVKGLNVGGDIKFLFKKDAKDKWKFVDPVQAEFADFTADIAGDILPTTGAIVAGIASIPSGPAGSAIAAGATEFGVGLVQDMVAKGLTDGVDFEGFEEIKDRAGQAALTTAVDYGTMKVGRLLPKGLFRKQGSDLATRELAEIDEIIKGGVPRYMMKGEAAIGKLQDIANRYPDGAIAKTLEDARQQIGKLVEDGVLPRRLEDNATRDILARGLDTLVKQTDDEIKAITRTLENLKVEKETLKLSKGSAKAAEQIEILKARKIFQENLENRVKNLRTKSLVSPEQYGLNLQQRLGTRFVEREAQGNKLFEEAYQNLANTNTNAGRLGNIFARTKNDVLLDLEDEVIQKLAPGATAGVDVTLRKLDDIADQSVSFKQLNEIIQLVEERTKRGSTTPGVTAGSFRQLAESLRNERARLLRSTDAKGRRSFTNANRFFRDEILPNREGAVFNAIKAEAGDSFDQAIKLFQSGREFKLPRMSSGGTQIIENALSSPKAVQNFLRAEGNTSEARRLLRETWLASKGLEAGKPFSKKSLNFSSKDFDIAAQLWDKKLAGGFSRKVDDLRRIAKFAATEDEEVAGMAAESFNKLMLESDEALNKQMSKIAEQEVAANKRLKELTSQRFIKMMNEGTLPLPSNQNGMELFAQGFLKATPADIDKLVARIGRDSPESLPSLRMSVYNDILQRAGRGTDDAQMGRLGYQLWNPEKLDGILRKEGPKLKKIIGTENFNQLQKLNKGLKRFAVKRPTGEEEALKASAAASFGGVSIFLSNITQNVKDKLISAAFTAEMALPFPVQKMLTADSYDRMMEMMTRGLFMTSRGTQALLQQAEADPEFRKFLTETYAQLIETSSESKEKPRLSVNRDGAEPVR